MQGARIHLVLLPEQMAWALEGWSQGVWRSGTSKGGGGGVKAGRNDLEGMIVVTWWQATRCKQVWTIRNDIWTEWDWSEAKVEGQVAEGNRGLIAGILGRGIEESIQYVRVVRRLVMERKWQGWTGRFIRGYRSRLTNGCQQVTWQGIKGKNHLKLRQETERKHSLNTLFFCFVTFWDTTTDQW